MKPFDFPLIADENIHPEVVSALKGMGHKIQSVNDLGLASRPDRFILQFAYQASCVVLTHDSDFGGLAINQGEPFVGIIYLRPGHIRAEFTLETIAAIEKKSLDVHTSFIVVAERLLNTINIRVRQL